ncbi:hypothetical protein SAMN06298212_10653 [Ruaniaceae bacterium KH17]|nr:hypothetical protein SAMN06298212_10653 [Ruaniaceae bacterium KH17]
MVRDQIASVRSMGFRRQDDADGVSFYAETAIDIQIPVLGALLNWLARPFLFSRATADHWIRHHIEETGRTSDILPAIYNAAHPMNQD